MTGPDEEPRRFGFRPVDPQADVRRQGQPAPAPEDLEPLAPVEAEPAAGGAADPSGPWPAAEPPLEVPGEDSASGPAAQQPDGPRPAPAPTLEGSWILALAAGFVGGLGGGLVGVPGAGFLGPLVAFTPLWLRILRDDRPGRAALAVQAWLVGTVASAAGLGAEGLALRAEAAAPLARAYQALVPLQGPLAEAGVDRWPSLVPGLALLGALIAGARAVQGLPALALAGIPLAWMAARAARYVEAASEAGRDPATAFLLGAPPQHLLVLGGALAVVAVRAAPSGARGWPEEGTPARRIVQVGLSSAGVGLFAEPWIDALWRMQAAI